MSDKTIAFKLIAPDRVAFDGQAQLVIAVTTEGEEGILPLHAPFLAALKPGILRANVIADGWTSRLELATSEGFMQAEQGKSSGEFGVLAARPTAQDASQK